MKKQNAAGSLAILTLFCCFGFAQSSVTSTGQKKTRPVLLMWTADFDGHALCTSRDVLLECAGYKQTFSSLEMPKGGTILGIEYRSVARERHLAQSLENYRTNPFLVVSALGDASRRLSLPISEAVRSSIDGVHVSFPAHSVLSATYFAAGPSEPIVPGKLIVYYTIQ